MFGASNENADPRRAKLNIWKAQKMAEDFNKHCAVKPPFVVQKNPASKSFLSKPLRVINGNQQTTSTLGGKRKKGDMSAATSAVKRCQTPPHTNTDGVSVDATCTSPRKDLGSIFADEGQTSFLTDMLAEMSVETKAVIIASTKKESKRVSFDKTIITTSPSLKRFRLDESQKTPKKQEVVVRDANFFRAEAETQRSILEDLSLNWSEISKNTPSLSDDQKGEIALVVGQAHLLCTKKIKQYFGLCDLNGVAKPADGLTARDADLDGFWDVIMMQVDDVKNMFAKLEALKEGGWEIKEEKCRAPRKKKRGGTMKKSATSAINRLRQGAQPGPVTPRRQAAKARMAAFRQAMRNRKPSPSTSEDAGRKPMLTPVRATKKEQQEFGSDFIVTSVRRSTRKTPNRYRNAEQESDVAKMLESTEYAYKPNAAMSSPSTSNNAAAPHHSDQLSKYLFDDDTETESPIALSTTRSTDTSNAPHRPLSTPSSSSSLQTGSVKKFASVTPSAKMRAHLGTNVIFTPVRRSRRLEETDSKCIEEASDLPLDSGYIPNPMLEIMK